MEENTVIMIIAILRIVLTCTAIAGSVYLAYHGKDGWGWLIVLAIILGSFSVRHTEC